VVFQSTNVVAFGSPADDDGLDAPQAGHQLAYLSKLVSRMQILRFPDEDPVWREAMRARSASQALYDAARLAGHK
jgi:hypothetical protein